ncbi:MAG: hypothetical protein FWD63_08260 [Propionibacteriaceae bacterium]|nr:hypothetical protein [Propionibacteriaceae bacterium]
MSSSDVAVPEWVLVPGEGITCGTVGIRLGQDRASVRQAMGFASCVSNYPDEDDFKTDDGLFVRVGYGLDGEPSARSIAAQQNPIDLTAPVRQIMFLGGNLTYRGVALHDGVKFGQIKQAFKDMGLGFRDSEWMVDGKDCPDLRISIATRRDVGGDGKQIEWVILATDFT